MTFTVENLAPAHAVILVTHTGDVTASDMRAAGKQIQAMADKIMTRAVRTKTMPQGNKTGMTEEERTVLKRWILQGAEIP
jgi:uncharacterized membrane protein